MMAATTVPCSAASQYGSPPLVTVKSWPPGANLFVPRSTTGVWDTPESITATVTPAPRVSDHTDGALSRCWPQGTSVTVTFGSFDGPQSGAAAAGWAGSAMGAVRTASA